LALAKKGATQIHTKVADAITAAENMLKGKNMVYIAQTLVALRRHQNPITH